MRGVGVVGGYLDGRGDGVVAAWGIGVEVGGGGVDGEGRGLLLLLLLLLLWLEDGAGRGEWFGAGRRIGRMVGWTDEN